MAQALSMDPADRRAGRILLASSGLSLAIVALTFIGYQRIRFARVAGEFRATPAVVSKIALKFITATLGVAVKDPYYSRTKWIMAGLLVIAIGCLASRIIRRGSWMSRPLLGLAIGFGSTLVVALVFSYGRAGMGSAWLESGRYGAPAAPTLLGLYLVWEACGPRGVRRFGRAALFGLAFALLAPNWAEGVAKGWAHRNGQEAFLVDVRAGMPIPRLIGRHYLNICYRHDVLEGCLRLLRDRRHGDYARIAPDPAFRRVRLIAPAATMKGATWDGQRGRATTDAPELTFNLDRPTPIAGIRMTYSTVNPGGWVPIFVVAFRAVDLENGRSWRILDHLYLKADGRASDMRFWFDATVDRVQIRPDVRPCDFTLSDVELLVPDPPWEPAGVGLPDDAGVARGEGDDGRGTASRPTPRAAVAVESTARVQPAGIARRAPEPRS
jgi:hypothetical protein